MPRLFAFCSGCDEQVPVEMNGRPMRGYVITLAGSGRELVYVCSHRCLLMAAVEEFEEMEEEFVERAKLEMEALAGAAEAEAAAAGYADYQAGAYE